MLIPLSWIKQYVDIKMPFAKLATLMSESGLTIEKWEEKDGDIVFDPEVTPNRPDWLSVVGIAREIAAVTGEKFSYKEPVISLKKIKNPLGVEVKHNLDLVLSTSAVTIRNIKVGPSPAWLQKRIKQIGLRPINNIVDVTNYVLWENGTPLHAFDYDKIRGHQMKVHLSKKGDTFRSLDGIDYVLPEGAIVISDLGRIIDLLPLKGGENTAISADTHTIFLHSVVCHPIITRHTSQALGLRSDSSAVSEKGIDPEGTTVALKSAINLILDVAGGEIASEITENKKTKFVSTPISISHERLEKFIGVELNPKTVTEYFNRLKLPVQVKDGVYTVSPPSFRQDLKIEEDLIEEVARLYNYNNLPKTLPKGSVPTTSVAYVKNFDQEYELKESLKGAGYSETYTYSLVAKDHLEKLNIDPQTVLRIVNPISQEFEYLRTELLGNLLDSIKANQANFPEVKIYELGKRYLGPTVEGAIEENWLWAGCTGEKFFEAKGVVEMCLQKLNVSFKIRPATEDNNHHWLHPGRTAQIETEDGKYLGVIGQVHPSLLNVWKIKGPVTVFAFNYSLALKIKSHKTKVYEPVSKFPSIIEDLSLSVEEKQPIGEIIETIKSANKLVNSVELIDIHEGSKAFRIVYLDPTKNLDDKSVAMIRTQILKALKERFGIKEKN